MVVLDGAERLHPAPLSVSAHWSLLPPLPSPYSTTFMTSLYFYIEFNIYLHLVHTSVSKLTSLRSGQVLGSSDGSPF